MEALRSEFQIVTDRLKGSSAQPDDKKYSVVLQLELSLKNLQNLTFEAVIAKREHDITKRITKFEIFTEDMNDAEVENYVDRLKKDIEIFNNDIKAENVKRSTLIEIVKKDYVAKSCKNAENRWKE